MLSPFHSSKISGHKRAEKVCLPSLIGVKVKYILHLTAYFGQCSCAITFSTQQTDSTGDVSLKLKPPLYKI